MIETKTPTTKRSRYETYMNAPCFGYVKQYLRALRRYQEDESDRELDKEMNELWKQMDDTARMFLFDLFLGSPGFYFPRGAIKKMLALSAKRNKTEDKIKVLRGTEVYWKVLFETFGTYKQR